MQVVLPSCHFTKRDQRHAAGAIAVAGIKLMRHLMNNQVKARGVERILNVEPVEDNRPLLPALPGLYHPLVVYQPDIVLPLVIDNERRGVDQHFVETVQPFNTERQHRQAEKQGDTGVFQRIQLEPLQRHQAFLLQKAIRHLNQFRLLIRLKIRQNRDRQRVIPRQRHIPASLIRFPGPLNHRFARKLVT